ncbi:hypothetical protein ACGLHS_06660 [Variovorax sp. VaC1]|uniref:hypothetical protein n=1 Tax=Variovorax sp. VaC1 TaxID=3373132 RepID=UPI00374806C8
MKEDEEGADTVGVPSAGSGVRDLVPGIRKEKSCEEAAEFCPQHRIAGNADLEFAYLFFMTTQRSV